jgi:hypothetical protein
VYRNKEDKLNTLTAQIKNCKLALTVALSARGAISTELTAFFLVYQMPNGRGKPHLMLFARHQEQEFLCKNYGCTQWSCPGIQCTGWKMIATFTQKNGQNGV